MANRICGRVAIICVSLAGLVTFVGCGRSDMCDELRDCAFLKRGGPRLGASTDRTWSAWNGISVDRESGRIAQISNRWNDLTEDRALVLYADLLSHIGKIGGGEWGDCDIRSAEYVVRSPDGDRQTYKVAANPNAGSGLFSVTFVCSDENLMRSMRKGRSAPEDESEEERSASYNEDPERHAKTVKYVVGENEDLMSVSIAFLISPQDIRRWNGMPDDGKLKPGQEIVLKLPIEKFR